MKSCMAVMDEVSGPETAEEGEGREGDRHEVRNGGIKRMERVEGVPGLEQK